MAGFEAIAAARREGVNCAFDGPNRLAARSEADHPRVIVFAVPALKGWRAEVDGQPARLLAQADCAPWRFPPARTPRRSPIARRA